MTRSCLLLAALAAGLAAPAMAQPGPSHREPGPRPFETLIQCRSLSDPGARLACFDSAAAALEQAAERRDVVVVDRAQVRESRRRLFGLALPSLPVFGGGGRGQDHGDDEVSTLEGVVASATTSSFGQWSVRLRDEGGLWVQVDHNTLALDPRPGQAVVIRRGPLGSYIMRIGNQPGIRVRRQL